ncbi:DEAD/DEAH box helicase [Aquibacillus rhizosphaerae]|uniref:DEAD/DEAH box helicase n=1 Tax=Aquibacillus rhizosphaerae TaxID=3051431 RepID=A0ABT7L4T3_9BACI|nr:DEAD/DEAH box helicase [Aquibacillus sp. LR5S19]MDL4840871.1 DEAD/DEAH box helicase [Aquibacillus sp. LR5S19]
MDIRLNQKIIKEKCGSVSYKSGETFYKSNKIIIENYDNDLCEATVVGKEKFYVIIEKREDSSFRSSCSCPKLASFSKDCQHIAAVLLAICDKQHQCSVNSVKHDSLLTIFQNNINRSSRHQLHFENRRVLDVLFTCKLVTVAENKTMFGVEIEVSSNLVTNIREFLEDVKQGLPSVLSTSFTFDLSLHCFSIEIDAVLQQLIEIVQDEKVYLEESGNIFSNQLLLIPPSSWERLKPLLMETKKVKIVYSGKIYNEFEIENNTLPLQFDFIETEAGRYYLQITGLDNMILLNTYRTVLYDGKITKLENQDSIRLAELKRMVDGSASNKILIPQEQLNMYLEKVIPGLKRLGDVHIAKGLTKKVTKTPLVAKLFLDRVKNRLLAGIEFHYENFVINPLEVRDLKGISMFVRDINKEEEILQIMEESLFSKTESGYYLHNEQLEYQFLYHTLPKLQKLTQIYTTTAIKNRVIKENTFPKINIKVKRERTNWLEFKFEMEDIPQSDIRDLLGALEEKRKYYRLRNGSLLSLETSEFDEINRFLHALPDQKQDLEKGLELPVVQSLRLLETVNGDIFKYEKSFRQFLDTISNPGNLPLEVPKTLSSILRDYQIYGYKWMKTLASYGFGGILADDMGLGKTLQSIAFIVSELDHIREKSLPVLIVCPSSITYNWLNEISKFASELQAVVIDGSKSERIKLQKDLNAVDVIITSYPILRQDTQWFEKQTFHTVFFDEAQAFKNPLTQTARAVKKIQANHRFALTGTPVENALEELWSIFHIVFPELFQGLKEYSNLSRKTIARRIRPFLLRRMKADVLEELPEKIETISSSELLPDQKKLYAAYLAKLRHDTLKHLDKDTFRKNKIRILAGITRLRQICCHPGLFVDEYNGSSAKFEQLMQILEDSMQSGRRVLIFSQFTKMLYLIGRKLTRKQFAFFYLDGQTPSEERVEVCNRFNHGERDIFLISLKAGGTGLNLTGADTVILYDSWWNPAVEQQAADRAYRIGQTSAVQVIKLVAKGTIEEKMNELQDKKRHLIGEIIDSEHKAQIALTEDDIRDILMIK